MGIFRQNFDRPGPGVAKDAPRKKGAARFFEILGRDAGSLFKAGLLVGLAYIPVGIFVGFGLFSLSMPVTLLAAGVGGLLTGPLLAGLYDTVMRALRDEPGYWWHTYKRAMKANWKQAMIAGVVLNLLVGAQVFAGWAMLLGAMQESLAFLAGVGLNVMVTAMVATSLFPQMVVMDVPMLTLFKNALFCTVGFAPRVLAASLLQILSSDPVDLDALDRFCTGGNVIHLYTEVDWSSVTGTLTIPDGYTLDAQGYAVILGNGGSLAGDVTGLAG